MATTDEKKQYELDFLGKPALPLPNADAIFSGPTRTDIDGATLHDLNDALGVQAPSYLAAQFFEWHVAKAAGVLDEMTDPMNMTEWAEANNVPRSTVYKWKRSTWFTEACVSHAIGFMQAEMLEIAYRVAEKAKAGSAQHTKLAMQIARMDDLERRSWLDQAKEKGIDVEIVLRSLDKSLSVQFGNSGE